MQRVFITGSNRGIGLEFVRQCLERGYRVFASCRQPEAALDLLALGEDYANTLSIIQLDVTNATQLDAAHDAVRAAVDGLDWLINNAGIYGGSTGAGSKGADRLQYQELGHLRAEALVKVFEANSVAPLLIAQRFLDLLKAGDNPCIASISSGMGSLTNRASGGSYAYVISKAALNMATRALSFDVARYGIVAVVFSPGWVQTDMGAPHAPLTVEQSVSGMLHMMDGLTDSDNGAFLRWDGDLQPW